MFMSDFSEALIDMIPFGVYIVDIESYEIIYVNREFEDWHAVSPGNICYESIYGNDKPCSFCKAKHLIEDSGMPSEKTYVFEVLNENNDCWYQYQDKAIYWGDGRIVKYSVASDITQLKETQNRLREAHSLLSEKNKQLKQLAVTDQLTNLKNRFKIEEVFIQELDKAERYGRPLSVILLDIDHFKQVNDTFGHQTGDIVLKETSHILSECTRKTDVVGRWGGEEFIIICIETALQGAISLAEHIRKSIESHKFKSLKKLTASLGISEYVKGDDQNSLIARADEALYEAKASGRNCIRPIS